MDPHPDEDPLPFYSFTGREAVFDVIYTPLESRFLARAKAAGCRVENGFNMLTLQAKYQYRLFFGSEYPEEI
jgi:3-dehydroquinate dehydratase/shikimate dehydrogenase